jgi:hypothetical protein
MLAGKCFCGAVHYAVADEFLYAMNCHCSNCRRTTGSAFKPFAGIERGKLRLTEGEDSLLVYGDDKANDTHCKRCGSLLYSVVRDGAFVHVALGTLVDHRRPAPIRRACDSRPTGRRIGGRRRGARRQWAVRRRWRGLCFTQRD